jgi:methyl-accepting chemotaxis protein
MDTQQNQQRIKAIYQMFFEMATGNLSFRIIKTDQNDEVGKLSEMLNNLAGKMHDIILQNQVVNLNWKVVVSLLRNWWSICTGIGWSI